MRKVAEPLKLTQSQVNNVGTLLKYPLDGALHWCVTACSQLMLSTLGKIFSR